MPEGREDHLEKFKKRYPEKFIPEKTCSGAFTAAIPSS